MRPPARTTRSARSPEEEETSSIHESIDSVVPSKSSSRAAASQHKAKKPRHRMTDRQLERLENLYQEKTHPSRQVKMDLASDVGMDIRTVTIWFQNRRQIAKKAAAEGDTRRLPLSTVTNIHRQASIASPFTTRSNTPAILVPTDCSLSLSTSSSSSSVSGFESRRSTPNTSFDDATSDVKQVPSSKRPRTLEWACAREEKRRKMSATRADDGEGDDLGDTTDDEEESIGTIPDPQEDVESQPINKRTRKLVTIPREYKAIFPADIVYGASLLLSLKHS
ncbi:hypothetical protein C8Q75DRAFT_809588 [Abortiporus biennis]|nr:hypothetical protein C8Q75DRAFT_809588 [Abortiporus biennis]